MLRRWITPSSSQMPRKRTSAIFVGRLLIITSPQFVLPCYVRLAARELRGTDVKVATVVSFPFGADETPTKAVAVHEAIQGGASELDAVMNISKFLSGEFAYVAKELASLNGEIGAAAMNNGMNNTVFKVIVETG